MQRKNGRRGYTYEEAIQRKKFYHKELERDKDKLGSYSREICLNGNLSKLDGEPLYEVILVPN